MRHSTKRYEKTILKEKIYKEAGYSVVSIWEADWKKIKKKLNDCSLNSSL